MIFKTEPTAPSNGLNAIKLIAAYAYATGASALLRRKILKISRYVFHVLACKLMGHGLHDASLGAFLGALKNRQLFNDVV